MRVDMKLVFVASPFKGNVKKNTTLARGACLYVLDKGQVPFAPHLFFTQFLDDNDAQERAQGINAGCEMLKRCDELWWFGDVTSEGMLSEMRMANESGIPIKHVSTEEIRQWLSK